MLEELLRLATLTVETAATLLRGLSTNPWVHSVDCMVTFEPFETEKTVRHGLGHALNGAAVVGCTDWISVSVGFATDPELVTVWIGPPSPEPFTVKLRCY